MIRLRVATKDEAVSLDNLEAPLQATVTDKPLYFTYNLEHVEELENHLLLLNVSNRTKLQVYVHVHPFPDSTYHHYPLGNVPKSALAVLFKQSLKMEIFEDSTPFIYD